MAEEETDTIATEIDDAVATDIDDAAMTETDDEVAEAPPESKRLALDKAQVAKAITGAKATLANPDSRRFLAGALVGALALYAGGTVFASGDTGTSSGAATKVESLRADLAELRADLAVLQAGGGAANEVATDPHDSEPEGAGGHQTKTTGGGDHSTDAPADDHTTDAPVDDHGSADEPPHWTYAESDNWGALADDYIECAEGSEQSPIDLSTEWDRVDSTTEIIYAPVPVTVVDNGHTIQVSAEGAGSVSQQRHEYELVQFHFHAPSEHTIDGEHHAAEVHLVHKDADGKLAVVGIMIDRGAELPGFETILDAIGAPNVEHNAGEFDPSLLLPGSRDFFHYRGSLTTPPCTEGVAWRVMAEPITMSAAQLDELTSHFTEPNNRPVQPRHERDAHIDLS